MKVFFTLTGTKHYFGKDFLKPGMKLLLKKEPDNEYDKEAIMVTVDGLGKIGYVANSPYTVIGESMSAGRIYDKIGNYAYGVVKYVLPQGVICTLTKKSLMKGKENDCFYLKKKLFRKYLDNILIATGQKSIYFEVYSKKQLLQAIEIFKEYAEKS